MSLCVTVCRTSEEFLKWADCRVILSRLGQSERNMTAFSHHLVDGRLRAAGEEKNKKMVVHHSCVAAAERGSPNHTHRCERQTHAQKYVLPTAGDDRARAVYRTPDVSPRSQRGSASIR